VPVRQDLAMKRSLVGAVAALLVLSACGTYEPEVGDPESPTQEPSVTAEPTSTAPPSPDELVVEPGRVGPAVAGMSKDEAVATGLFDADVPAPAEGCEPYDLVWKKEYTGLDVLTTEDGSIAAIGSFKGGPKTEEGIGFGSTLREVRKAYPDLSSVADVGFGQAGAFVVEDDAYIGFLFGEATQETVTKASRVTVVEVTNGTKPDLMRSGC
jgi:hypothetical protein